MFDAHEKKQNEWHAVQTDQQRRLEAFRGPFDATTAKLRDIAKAEGMTVNQAMNVSGNFMMFLSHMVTLMSVMG